MEKEIVDLLQQHKDLQHLSGTEAFIIVMQNFLRMNEHSVALKLDNEKLVADKKKLTNDYEKMLVKASKCENALKKLLKILPSSLEKDESDYMQRVISSANDIITQALEGH